MSTRKTLVLVGLALIVFPLRHPDFSSRIADDCKCDRAQLACKILCSGIGSDPGTGGGSSTFNVAPGVNRPDQERPIIVPRKEIDTKSPSEQVK